MLPRLVLVCALIACARSEESCQSKIKEERCEVIFEDKNNCKKSEYATLECRVTCSNCKSFECENLQDDSVFDCSGLADQCNVLGFAQIMKDKCPATCGQCDVGNSKLCTDTGGSDNCAAMAVSSLIVLVSNFQQFCNSLTYYDMMTRQCASTCNRCSIHGENNNSTYGRNNDTCSDQAANCASYKPLCDNTHYAALMTRLCAQTCNKCGVCEDESEHCPAWAAKGFCSNSSYDADYKTKECPKTCGLCADLI